MRTMIAAAMAAALTCALAVLTPAAPASVTTPTSGWFWGDPTPQGNQIDDMAFAGSRGYAIGHFGSALRTDDGGQTWTGLRTGLTANLTTLSVPAADTVVVGAGCLARRSTDGGATFTRVRFSSSDTRCRAPLAVLAFATADQGYVLTADGSVQFTTDGGQSFAARTAIPGTPATGGSASPTEMALLSATHGFVTTSTGQIYETSDGGTSWTQRATRIGSFSDITFASPTTAYAVGSASGIFVSTDGGQTWNPAAATGAPGGLDIGHVSCSGPSQCVALADGSNSLLRTADGWGSVQVSTPATQPLYAAAFAAGSRVVVAGFNGITRVSDDAGAAFAPVGTSLGFNVQRLRNGPGGLAFAPGSGGMIGLTADGGRSWTRIAANTPDTVLDVAFPSPTVGYAIDSGGLVEKTNNTGASWTELDTGAVAPRAVLAPTATTVVLLGRGIRRSTNGETFDPVGGRAGRTSVVDGDQAGSALFAWGGRTVLFSTNGGRTWGQLRKPGPRLSVRDLDFVTPTTGFLLDTAGRLYKTANRGRRWTELTSLGTGTGSRLSFSSPTTGYVITRAIPGTVVSKTGDGGRSFAPELVDALVPDGEEVLATGPATALLEAANGNGDDGRVGSALFATATGGQDGSASALTLTASTRRLRRAGNVAIRGRLRPAEGGEVVTIARFDLRRGRWSSRTVHVTSSGSFATTWRIGGSAAFVATWPGDDNRAGDGSAPLVVHVGRR